MSPRFTVVGVAVLVATGASGTSGCGGNAADSERLREIDALGPEDPSRYPVESALHRPGESCTSCHSPGGTATTHFAFAGTVFWGPSPEERGVPYAYVRITDANKVVRCVATHCNGSFFIPTDAWPNVQFPVRVEIERTEDPGRSETTLVKRRMSSKVYRETSCAGCHVQGLLDHASPDQVRLFDQGLDVDRIAERIALTAPTCDLATDIELRCPEDR